VFQHVQYNFPLALLAAWKSCDGIDRHSLVAIPKAKVDRQAGPRAAVIDEWPRPSYAAFACNPGSSIASPE
jgi:hypothetical protein